MTSFRKILVRGYFFGLTAAILWGFHAVVIRMLINQGINPFLIGALRLFIGSATLALIIAGTRAVRHKNNENWLPPKIHYSKFFWLTAVGLGVNFLLFHKGMEYTIASDAMLIEAFAPVMVLIIVMLFMPHRITHLMRETHLPQRVLQIVIIGSVGSFLLLINDPKDILITTKSKLIGDIIEFIAMFAWALVLLGMHEYQKREPNHDSLAATAQFLFVGGLVMAPFVPWTELVNLTADHMFWILILAVFSTGIAYFLWHLASKYLDVFPLMTIFNFGSIFNVTTETIVLGLKLTWKLVVGGLLILYAAIHAEIINTKYKILNKEEAPTE